MTIKKKAKNSIQDSKMVKEPWQIRKTIQEAEYSRLYEICIDSGFYNPDDWDEGGGFTVEAVAKVLEERNLLLAKCLALFTIMNSDKKPNMPSKECLENLMTQISNCLHKEDMML